MSDVYTRAREAAYESTFAIEAHGSFRGVFRTLEEAARSAPTTKPMGFDSRQQAAEYLRNATEGCGVVSYDYPVLFWLGQLLEPGMRIFDFGSNVGIHYHSYKKYLTLPPDLLWTVCDLPAMIEAGRTLARTMPAPHLAFTDEPTEGRDADVFLSSGTIQYVAPLAELLTRWNSRPRHLLLNRIPLYEGPQYATLQNGGPVFYPQLVFNRAQFVTDLCAPGYKLMDEWKDHVDSCIVPFHEDRFVRSYSGLYMSLIGHDQARGGHGLRIPQST